jgi:hypothetical protein
MQSIIYIIQPYEHKNEQLETIIIKVKPHHIL